MRKKKPDFQMRCFSCEGAALDPVGGIPAKQTHNTMKTEQSEERHALIIDYQTSHEEITSADLVVTRSGALVKNRYGKTAPDNNLRCSLTKMVVTSALVKLFFPEGECCDMQAAVRLATRACETVEHIQTSSGQAADTCYLKRGGEWVGILASQMGQAV
jgi:hypothetical protein